MAFSRPLAWIANHGGIQNVFNHHIFVPSDIQENLNLPDTTAFTQGARQFFFWKGDMALTLPKNTIILSFIGPEGLQRPDIIGVMEALSTIIDLSTLIEVYQGANTSFFGLSFKNPETVSQISQHFLYFNNSVVAHITHSASNIHPFRLLWLPPLFSQDRVHHLLSSLTGYHSIRRENLKTSSHGYTPTNIIRGLLAPKEGQSINNLPHLIALPAPHKGSTLLLITGRDPICLKCREIGHLRKNCPMQKCASCSKVHFSSSSCGTSSYSSVTSRNITHLPDSDWLSLALDTNSTNIDDPADPSLAPDNSSTHTTPILLQSFSRHVSQPSASSSKQPTLTQLNSANSSKSDLISFNSSSADYDHTSSSHTSHDVLLPATKPIILTTVDSLINLPTQDVISVSTDPEPMPLISSPSRSVSIVNKASSKSFLQPSSDSDNSTTPSLHSPSNTKKRIISTTSSPSLGLRSEVISFIPHSSPSRDSMLDVYSPIITSDDHSEPPLNISIDSQHSSDSESSIDITTDFISTRPKPKHSYSRKRKKPTSSPPDDDVPSCSDSHSSAQQHIKHLTSTPSLDKNPLLPTMPDITTVDSPVLSDADAALASQLCLSHSHFQLLKLHCPDQTITSDTLRKLKLLITFGIPLLQVTDHPLYFTIPIKTLSARFKSLSQRASSPVTLFDITNLMNKSRSLT